MWLLVTLLTIAFVALKLSDSGSVAKWSWWWVLSPLWIYAILLLITILVVVGVLGLDGLELWWGLMSGKGIEH